MKKKQLQELREKTDHNLRKELKNEKAKLSDLRFDLSLGKVTNIKTIKKKGNVSELADDFKLKGLNSTKGIAHTRWATHGEPTEKNAHPHISNNKEIVIVHNGIIENNLSLK